MRWEGKKVLVTGGAGAIGRELINKLTGSGASMLCIDREPKAKDMPPQVEYCQADISEMDTAVIDEFSPEIIFHLAATFERTQETAEFWESNFKNNVILSHKVINVIKKCASLEKFIFASSYLIYSPDIYLFPQGSTRPNELKETDLLNPRNLCGAAKYYTEKELAFIKGLYSNFAAISARIYRVYGLGSRDIISRWIRMALNSEQLIVFQKENMFDYIFAGDVAEGLIKITENVDDSEIINLGSGTARKIEDVIKILKGEFPDIKVKEVKSDKPFEASCADISKLIKLTGYQPSTSLEEGIAKAVNYEKRILKKAYK